MKKILLIGCGHAHLFVLEYLITNTVPDTQVILISPSIWHEYSGMLPGWMAGYYVLDDCRINIKKLVEKTQVTFIEDTVTAMRAEECYVVLSSKQRVYYDSLSLDIGSDIRMDSLAQLGAICTPVKPFDEFRSSWTHIIAQSQKKSGYTLVVIGGGAAGVELSFAAQDVFLKKSPSSKVILIAGQGGILRNHAAAVKEKVQKALSRYNIHVISQRAIADNGKLLLDNGQAVSADKIIAATQAMPAAWLSQSQLALDSEGYVLVNRFHQSVSHVAIFAVGNVCSREDTHLERSGVHAVRVGPILVNNLLAHKQGKALKSYNPRKKVLYLLACPNQRAIASWGRWSAHGIWIWRLKDWIDRHFISRFTIR